MSNYDKFTQALIHASLESWQDDDVGSITEAPGEWAALFTFETQGVRDSGWSDVDGSIGYSGAILFCNNDGIYSCERYSDANVLAKRWEQEVKDLTVEDNENDA